MAVTFDPYDPRAYAKALSESILNPGAQAGGDATGTRSSQAQSSEWSTSGQNFADPQQAIGAGANLSALMQTLAPAYTSFLENPAENPAIANAIALQQQGLGQKHALQQRGLMDEFRLAGNTRSSAMNSAMAQLLGSQFGERLGVSSDVMQKLYPAIAQGMNAPLSQADQLLASLKLSQDSSQGSSTDTSSGSTPYFAPQQGGGGGVSGPTSVGFAANAPLSIPTAPTYSRSSPNPYISGPSMFTDVPGGQTVYGNPAGQSLFSSPNQGEQWEY